VNDFVEVRDYVYQALLALVRIHAQVSGVAKPLLERTMNSLVEDLTSEAFTCFQKVEKFGMGGMLRVRSCMFVSTRIRS
jgi:exocyst complex component 2